MSEDQPLPYIPDYAQPDVVSQAEAPSTPAIQPTASQERAAERFEERNDSGQYDDGMTVKDIKAQAGDYITMMDPSGDGKVTGAEIKAALRGALDPSELEDIRNSMRGDFEKVQHAIGDSGYAALDPKDQAMFRGVIGGMLDPIDVMYSDKAVVFDRGTVDTVGKMAGALAGGDGRITESSIQDFADGEQVSPLPAPAMQGQSQKHER